MCISSWINHGLIIFVLLQVWGFVIAVETNFYKPIKMWFYMYMGTVVMDNVWCEIYIFLLSWERKRSPCSFNCLPYLSPKFLVWIFSHERILNIGVSYWKYLFFL